MFQFQPLWWLSNLPDRFIQTGQSQTSLSSPFQQKGFANQTCFFPGYLTMNAKNFLWNSRSRTSIGEGNGNPFQYSCLENPMDRGAWKAAVHGVTKSRTQPSDFTFTFHFHALEKEMASHSSVLAWRIPGMGEPGGLPSMGLHRVRHDWSDLAAATSEWAKISW